jgi:TPP-dependent pyruvate/acetoin dehydrogenase alpha subunit
MKDIPRKELLRLYETMLRIRMIEERIADLYPLGQMRTPTHFSIGQEAVSTGVCSVLNDDDMVFASHRSHAAYLAKGGDLKLMLAELYGRATGTCKGRSGSAHLSSPGKNMYSAPIVGEMIAVAVGAALAFYMDGSKRVSVAFFGDAAMEEGVYPESLNFAVIKKLPVIFVCENNFFSTHTHIRYRQPDIPIYKRARSFGLESQSLDGNNVITIYVAAKNVVKRCREGEGPFFLECITYRYREHVGPNFDFDNPYRTKEEVERWMRRCPVKMSEKILFANGDLRVDKVNSLKDKISCEIEEAVHYAEKSPWPAKGSLTEDVY